MRASRVPLKSMHKLHAYRYAGILTVSDIVARYDIMLTGYLSRDEYRLRRKIAVVRLKGMFQKSPASRSKVIHSSYSISAEVG